jgi:large subunit ribosomal protein L6
MTLRKNNKDILRIPQDVSLIFCAKQKILTANGPLRNKSMKLKLKIAIDPSRKTVSVSSMPLFRASNAEKKRINMLKKTTLAQIKYLFIESSIMIYQKLKIIGVGFRADFATTILEKKILIFKLGLSHLTFVKIPLGLRVEGLTKTKFCICGNSYDEVTKFSASLRAQKRPEPYKGKGILYENEIIALKEGKKI